MMVKGLVAASLLWPMFLGGAVWQRMGGEAASSWSRLVYAAASHVCHQRPERSFHTAGIQWPVCGRCAGLYLAAPFGAVVGAVRRRPFRRGLELRWGIIAAAIPMAVTLGLEWFGASITSPVRAAAAVPFGIAAAYGIVSVAAGRRQSIK